MSTRIPARLKPLVPWLVWSAITLFGCLRIVDTYSFNSVTVDEPEHLGAGMEWLQQGRYTYEPQHPPLARVAASLGPFLDGKRVSDPKNFRADGLALVYADGDPRHNLAIARAGILPFFLLASLVVFLWGRHLGGSVPGLIATYLYTTIPPVLAHAGLATTDMALAATLPMSLGLFYWALRQDSFAVWGLFGVAVGLTLLSKLTALLFFAVTMPGIYLWHVVDRIRAGSDVVDSLRIKVRQLSVAGLLAGLVIWGGYRFSLEPLTPPAERPHEAVDKIVGQSGVPHDVVYALVEAPLPATELVRGIQEASAHVERGHQSYLLGKRGQHGWWYFFPVAVAVKTPIATLILSLIGGAVAVGTALQEREASEGVPLLCAVLLLGAVVLATVNIGVRHILPIYTFLAILGGIGAVEVLRRIPWSRGLASLLLLGLLAWQGASSLRAHPNYLAYFNEFRHMAGGPILVDSDRDWKQYLYLLEDALAQRDIERVHVALHDFKRSELSYYDFRDAELLEPGQRESGWLAVSAYKLYIEKGYEWLQKREPVEVIAKSLYLFCVPEDDTETATGTPGNTRPPSPPCPRTPDPGPGGSDST